MQFGGMMTQAQQVCSKCNGEGEVIPKAARCKTCNGQKIVSQPKRLEIMIDPGMQDGEHIVFRGMAHQAPGATTGDVIILVAQKPHAIFKRQGVNLYTDRRISLAEALGGFSFNLKLPDNKDVTVTSDPHGKIVSHGDIRILKDHGMPYRSNSPQRGDLYVRFEVLTPQVQFLDKETIKNLEPVLKQRATKHEVPAHPEKLLTELPAGATKPDFTVHEEGAKQQQRKYRNRQKQQEEDEEGGARCQQM